MLSECSPRSSGGRLSEEGTWGRRRSREGPPPTRSHAPFPPLPFPPFALCLTLSPRSDCRQPPVKKSRLFDKSASFTDPAAPAPAPLSPKSRRRLAVLSYQKLQGGAESSSSATAASSSSVADEGREKWVDLVGGSSGFVCFAPSSLWSFLARCACKSTPTDGSLSLSLFLSFMDQQEEEDHRRRPAEGQIR